MRLNIKKALNQGETWNYCKEIMSFYGKLMSDIITIQSISVEQ